VSDLVQATSDGLYCPPGDFHIDPWRPVDRAVVTHAHSDHARPGARSYLCAEACEAPLRLRVGEEASIETLPWGEPADINGVRVSLHPAGHILGSAQIRVEHQGDVWVVSGDYKTAPDTTCDDFEPVPCRVFISECTFALPVFRWRPEDTIRREINEWWRANQRDGRTSVVFAYALGKAQRVLSLLDPSIGPILAHGAPARLNPVYEAAGVELPAWERATPENAKTTRGRAIVIAPPSAASSTWIRKFGPVSTAFASGWTQIRGTRRRRSVDRGFVLSDHADWTGLLEAIEQTGAERIGATHGYTEPLVRYLKERGLDAWTVPTRYVGEGENAEAESAEADNAGSGGEDPSGADGSDA